MNFLEIISSPLIQRTIFIGLVVSLTCGIIGSIIVVKKISSISGGLAHVAFGGVGLGFLLNYDPFLGAFFVCILSALFLGMIYRKKKFALETYVSMLWSLSMALGMLFISLKPGYAPDISSYLFGSIAFVPDEYFYFVISFNTILLLILFLFFKELQAVTFDEEFAEINGLPVGLIFNLILIFIAIAVVILLKVVGAILTIALLTTPAVISREWCHNLKTMMLSASLISAVSICSGIIFSFQLSSSYNLDIPTGPSIIVICSLLYCASSVVKYLLFKNRLE